MAAKLARNSSLSTVDTDNLKEGIQAVSHNDLATIDEEQVDIGYAEYRKGLESEDLTPQQNRKIRWKIDLIVLPIFLVTQTIQFMDKTALNYANLFGFRKALNLTGTQFNWLSGIVYVGYFCAQYPASYLIGRYPAQYVISLSILLWGVCVVTMTQCTDFSTAMANRFFLGICEASLTPGLTLMTGFWWTRQEIPLRQMIWYCGLGLGGVIGSFISTGISKISDTAPGPQKWQYIFYILGGVTIVWSAIVFAVLPDAPANARFLSPEERIWAVKRVAQNQTGIKNKSFKAYQFWVALKDPKVIILFISVFAAAIPNGVLSSFSTQIINEMGFSATKTTVLTSVGNILQIVALLIGGTITLHVKNSRLITATAANIVCTVAAACTGYLPDDKTWMRLVAFWFTNFQSVGFAVGLVMINSNMGGYTHRSVASALVFTAYCWGNLAGPFVVKQSEAPRFPTAMAGLLAGYSIKLVCQLVLLIYLLLWNKNRDRQYGKADTAASKEAGMQDKTEFENTNFRYVY